MGASTKLVTSASSDALGGQWPPTPPTSSVTPRHMESARALASSWMDALCIMLRYWAALGTWVRQGWGG